MPDFEPLPRRPRAPVFVPRTGDYAVVVGRAKHRRRRHLGAAGASVAGLAAVVALSTGGAGGTFGLDPAPPAAGVTAPPDATSSADPSPDPEQTASPDPEESPYPGGEEEPGTNAGESPDPSDGEVPIDDGPLRPDDPAKSRPAVVRDDVAKSPTMVCDTDLGVLVPASGWCLDYNGPATAQIGVSNPYQLVACRHIGRGGATLTFDTEQQVEFEVFSDGGRRGEWHWSADYPFPQRTNTVRVEDGRCARWTIEWDAIGDDGDYLRPGEYAFSPSLRPSDWGAGTGGMAVGAAYGLTLTE